MALLLICLAWLVKMEAEQVMSLKMEERKEQKALPLQIQYGLNLSGILIMILEVEMETSMLLMVLTQVNG